MDTSCREIPPMTLQELEANIEDLIPELKEAAKKPALDNPFISRLQLTFLQNVKVGFLAFLIPIRFLLIGLVWMSVWVIGKIFLIGYVPPAESEPEPPMTGWRRHGAWLVKFMARMNARVIGFYHISVKGKMAESSEAPVVVFAPHTSFVDGFTACWVGKQTFVSRVENAKLPLIGPGIRLIQPIFVTREAKGSRQTVVKEIKRRAADPSWPAVAMFPEGTCTNGQALITFKPGAFYPGLPVQPVYMKYTNKFDYTTWTWEGPPTWKLLCIMCAQVFNKAEIHILPVYNPSEEEKEDPFLFARNVRNYMANYAKIPYTDHSFEDCRLMNEAHKHNMPYEAGLVEYYKISPMIGMNCETMIEFFQKFAAIDCSSDGVLDEEEFAKYLNLPLTEEIKAIFRIYDIGKNGTINFREYLLGFWLISRPFNTKVAISTAFSLFDKDSKGFISYEDVCSILKGVFDDIEEEKLKLIHKDMDKASTAKVELEDFEQFCLAKPEYALLFHHFTKLREQATKSQENAASSNLIMVEPMDS